MPSTYPVKISGVTIKSPYPLKISRFNITDAKRLPNGKMVMDFIAKKRKLFFTYAAITGREINTILDLIDTTQMFFPVSFYDNRGTLVTMTCYVGEISQQLQRYGYINDDSVWTDVTFDFIEQ